LSVASVATAPVWDTLLAADIPTIAQSQVSGLTTALANKLGTGLTDGYFFVGNAANAAVEVLMSQDGTLDNTGALTIADAAVTFAKMQDITYQTLMGRWSAGDGPPQEIAIGSGLTLSGAGVLSASGGGSGDVVGPASATDNAVARFDTGTGKLIQNSVVTIADTTGAIAGAQSITLGVASATAGTVVLQNATNAFTQTIRGTNPAASIVYDLPTTAPTVGQILSASAPSGGVVTLSWATGGGGAFIPLAGTTAPDLITGELEFDPVLSAAVLKGIINNGGGVGTATIGFYGDPTTGENPIVLLQSANNAVTESATLTVGQNQFQAVATTTTGQTDILLTGTTGLITGTFATFAGIEYAADYSANYTSRSLVDKGYVDSLTGLGPGGSDTELQYNNASVFGGITGATSNGTIVTLTAPQINGALLETSSTVGYVWTATDTAGAGAWAAPSGGGANTALSNLAAVSINAALIPQTGLDLGAAATAWKDLYLYGSGTFGSHSIRLTGTPTGNRVITIPDATDTLMVLGTAQTVTGAKTFGSAGSVGKLILAGNTSGTTILDASAVAGSTTSTLPATTTTLAGLAVTQTFTLGNTFSLSGATGSAITISGAGNTTNAGLIFSGSTNQWINMGSNGVAAPAFTTRSLGTKVVLFPLVGASTLDYAMGINTNILWFSVPDSARSFQWFSTITTPIMTLTGFGNVTIGQRVGTSLALVGFTYTGAVNTGQTASTEIPTALWTCAGRQWATGNFTTQREFHITSPTYTAVGASVINDAYTFYVGAGPTASTNMTVTRAWSGGFNGLVAINTGLYLGGLTTAPTAFLHIAAGTTAKAQIRFVNGAAPSAPNDGDLWFDGTDLFLRVSGVTKTFTLV